MSQEPSARTPSPTNLVGVQFQSAGLIHSCDAGQLGLESGDRVVVETEHGAMLGTVTALPRATATGPGITSTPRPRSRIWCNRKRRKRRRN